VVCLNDNRITTFGVGLAAVLAMMAPIQLFILTDSFAAPHDLMLVIQIPVGVSGEHVGPLGDCVAESCESLLTWSTQMTATAIIGLFAVLTVRILRRTPR
jgi:tellurite resistance protein